MKGNSENALTYIIFKEDNLFYAVCLEHYIGAQGSTWDQAETNLCLNYRAELDFSMQQSGEAFHGIPQAPEKYQKMAASGRYYKRTIIDRKALENKNEYKMAA
ncbi:MAG: hypothetical protein OXC82_03575 [Rhodobacteraceae bacterium]|nr:hypothetical protein [Paracoccaceae bacterium]MCY4249503.1 hypothetical protein [Paracoccaceae bacterium]MCY4308329.1 hypothetical protein [Paracoccaceae bacterium]